MIRRINLLFLMLFFVLGVFGWNVNFPYVGNEINNELEAAESEKVKDVVCGMEINKNAAMVVSVDGKDFYFCSENCKAKFEKNPWKVTCMCFVGLKEGDEPCDCNHCSGKGGKCDCGEHGGHGDGGHVHDHGSNNDDSDNHSDHKDGHSEHNH